MAKVRLSGPFGGLSGTMGKLVFALTERGTIMRNKPEPNNPDTPAQQAVRSYMTQATRLYRQLNAEQRKDWQDYAARVAAAAPGTDPRNVYLTFTGLTCKFLQMHPEEEPPFDAPDALFFGDGLTLTANPEPGAIRFAANVPNTLNVATELLLQPLAHDGRMPQRDRYRSQGFILFQSGILDFELTVEPGAYAPAYRFVNILTGQETVLAALPALTVSA